MALISLIGLQAQRPADAAASTEPKPAAADGSPTKVLDALTKFIPTELLAPYVAALSLASTQHWKTISIYLCFIAATPIAYLLFEFAKVAMENRTRPPVLPMIWRGISATVAFAVWGLAAPTNGLQDTLGGPAVAGFFATIVSPILTALDAIVLWLLGIKPN
jgi:hypothetical protein